MSSTASSPVVNSHNEWDPLEEIIVGILEGMTIPQWEAAFYSHLPPDWYDIERENWMSRAGGPDIAHREAHLELANFVRVLQAEGVTVTRPDPVDHARPFNTPDWAVTSGWSQSTPRDVLLAIGDEIIEAPMSWRARFFDYVGFRTVLNDYFARGARWTAVPKPRMRQSLYNNLYGKERVPGNWTLTEEEPVFDAADVVRCGKDIFFQRSQVTNEKGIVWLQRHLGEKYRVHRVETLDARAVHIDAQWMPLAPGKVLINPDRPMKTLPDCFKNKNWDFLECPRTVAPRDNPRYWDHEWFHMNVLMLDEKRVIVEASEEPLIGALRDFGLEPIPLPFRNCYQYGGSFHCYTLDVRRRGTLKSYF